MGKPFHKLHPQTQFKRLNIRRQVLIDKMLVRGLSSDEAVEMATVAARMAELEPLVFEASAWIEWLEGQGERNLTTGRAAWMAGPRQEHRGYPTWIQTRRLGDWHTLGATNPTAPAVN